MTTLTLKRLEELDRTEARFGVSIYCPLSPQPNGAQKNRTRLKNLISQARSQLRACGIENSEVEAVLAQCPQESELFLRHTAGTLALFVTPESCQAVEVPMRLQERVRSGYHYLSLKPLVTALSRHYQYFALTLSENQVKLYFGDWAGARKIPNPEGLPKDMDSLISDETHGPLFEHPTLKGHAHGSRPTNRLEQERQDRFLAAIAEAIKETVKNSTPSLCWAFKGGPRRSLTPSGSCAS